MVGISSVTAARLAKYKKRRRLPNGGMITWPATQFSVEAEIEDAGPQKPVHKPEPRRSEPERRGPERTPERPEKTEPRRPTPDEDEPGPQRSTPSIPVAPKPTAPPKTPGPTTTFKHTPSWPYGGKGKR